MRNFYQVFKKFLSIYSRNPYLFLILFILLSISGFLYLRKGFQKDIQANLEGTRVVIRAMWQSVTLAHEEAMRSLFEAYLMDPKTLEILRMANTESEEKQAIARYKLYRHLAPVYEKLKKDYLVRQLHFHTPDNRSFLRFHAPHLYGDDLSKERLTVVLANKLKKPQIAFESGKLFSGYRYVYPIIDADGTHLGSVEISRSFEAIRKTLSEVFPNVGYTLILRKGDVLPKLLELYRKYYQEIPGLEDWVIEDPYGELFDRAKPLSPEQERALRRIYEDQALRKILESPHDETKFVKVSDKYFKVTALKLLEPGKKRHTAVVLAISPGEDLEPILKAQKRITIIYVIAVALLGALIYSFLTYMENLNRKNRELEAITSVMGAGLFIMDKMGVITFVNDTALELLQYSREELLGKVAHNLIHEHTGPLENCPIYQATVENKPFALEDSFKRKDGSYVDVYVIGRPVMAQAGVEGSVLVFYDITERKRKENEIFVNSMTDPLTGLHNRRYLQEKFLEAKELADRYHIPFSVIMIDIDNFKLINDRFGHEVGDRVLKALAKVLKIETRSADLVSRWGGEEFLILLSNTPLEGAERIAERLRRTVEFLRIKDLPPFTISAGVTSYKPKEKVEELLRRVDKALYMAKASGKNCVKILD